KMKPELLAQIPTRFQTNIVTGSAGEWRSLPLPADASQLLVTLTQLDPAGKPKITELDASKLKINAREENTKNLRQISGAILMHAAKGAAAAPAAEPAALESALPAPEQAVVLDLHHPWIDATKFERNPAPNVYGIDLTRAAPRISLLDSNAKTMWACRLNVPIDAKKYPLVSFRYRVQNPGAKGTYVLRLVHGGQNRTAVKFFTPADLKSDGQVHELTADLRERNIDDAISEAGVALWSDDKPAWIDVIGISFSAASPLPKIGDDPEIKFTVTDLDGAPIAEARVIVDAERANFARSAETNDKGEASIKPLATESHTHMARVEKKGYMTIDHAIEGNAGEFKTTPAMQYGGIAQGDSGQASPNAQLTIRVKNKLIRDTGLMNYPLAVVTTDDKGKWIAPPLPADASLLTIQCKEA